MVRACSDGVVLHPQKSGVLPPLRQWGDVPAQRPRLLHLLDVPGPRLEHPNLPVHEHLDVHTPVGHGSRRAYLPLVSQVHQELQRLL